MRNPLNVEDVDFETPVNELYSNEKLPIMTRKAICNITIGLLEKKSNKGEISKIFKDYNEANFYKMDVTYLYSTPYTPKLLVVV